MKLTATEMANLVADVIEYMTEVPDECEAQAQGFADACADLAVDMSDNFAACGDGNCERYAHILNDVAKQLREESHADDAPTVR